MASSFRPPRRSSPMRSDRERDLVRLTLPSGVPPLARLRSRIATSLPEWHHDAVADVSLVAIELVTNAYLHGRPPIRFRMFISPETEVLRIEVSDSGSALPQVRCPDIHTPNGRGLQLINAISTRWGFTVAEWGKTVWAEFTMPRPPAGNR